MSFALIIIGVFLLVTAIRGTSSDLFTLLRGDFTGPNNFIYWMVAILLIGVIGYIPKARPISTALLALVVVVLFLKNSNTAAVGGGFFSQLQAGLQSTVSPSTATATTGQVGTTPGQTYVSAFPALSNLMDWLHIPGGPSGTAVPAPAPTQAGPSGPAGSPFPSLAQLGIGATIQ